MADKLDSLYRCGENTGDFVLVETLLKGSAGFVSTALQTITARCGLDNVSFSNGAIHIPDNHMRCAVQFAQRSFGFIHMPSSSGSNEMQARLNDSATQLGRWLALSGRLKDMEYLSAHDELTGLFNRRYFNRSVNSALQRSEEGQLNMALLWCDIVDFKSYNDTFGYLSGDKILKETAQILQAHIDKPSIVARIGGDEFAVVFLEAKNSTAKEQFILNTKRKLKNLIEAIGAHLFFSFEGKPIDAVTLCGGLSIFPQEGKTLETLLNSAEKNSHFS